MSATNGRPVIEVAISLDATMDIDTRIDDVVVFVDGELLRPERYRLVVNGHESESKVSLRDEAWNVTREGSTGYTELLDRWYRRAEDNAENDFVTVARCVQPEIKRAAELNTVRWVEDSDPDSPTRCAAQATAAVATFHAHEFGSSGLDALQAALELYRAATGHPHDCGLDVLLTGLLADLRHLAEAYEIRLESAPAPSELLAMDLRAVLAAIRYAASALWADELAATGKTLRDIEYDAFHAFLTDCTDSGEPQA